MNATLRFLCWALSSVVLGAGCLAGAAEGRRNSNGGSSAKNAATKNSTAKASEGPAPGSYESFQLILERNIFNPNRTGRTRANPDEKPPRADEISLVGVVLHGDSRVAVFESPDAALRKGVREGETLAEFKVERVGSDQVELVREGKPITLKVAQQLRRVEGEEWKVGTNQAARADPRALAGNGAAAGRPAEAPTSADLPADASEVLKRLMKQREKQLKK